MASLPEMTRTEFEAPDLVCKAVTVYSDRAEVKRLVKADLKPGANEVVVRRLPRSIDADSVRVDGRGRATICEVQYQNRHVKHEQAGVKEKETQLRKELDGLNAQRQQLNDLLKMVVRKGEVLDGVANQVANGPPKEKGKENDRPTGFALSEASMGALDSFLEFYATKVVDVQERVRKTEQEIKTLDESIQLAHRNLRELSGGGRDELSREVSIILEVLEAGEVELDVSYVVAQASWTPSYDLRVHTDGDKKVMKVHYYGMIRQNTGEDWTDAALSLSTATPNIGGQIPELKTLKASFYHAPPPQKARAKSAFGGALFGSTARQAAPMMAYATTEMDTQFEHQEESMATELTVVKDSVISTSFRIARPTTVPSDNTSHKVNVALVELTPTFEHTTVPCKTEFAYIKAKVLNTSAYPLLPGPVSVFLDNNFISKSQLKAVSPQEEFSVSLGVDAAVRVDYKPERKFHEETGYIGKTSVTITEQRIEIKNTRQEKVTIKLMERVPLSTEDKLKIVLVKPDLPKQEKGANGEVSANGIKLNADHILEWDIELNAGETKTVELKYRVENPPGERVEYNEAY